MPKRSNKPPVLIKKPGKLRHSIRLALLFGPVYIIPAPGAKLEGV